MFGKLSHVGEIKKKGNIPIETCGFTESVSTDSPTSSSGHVGKGRPICVGCRLSSL